MFSPQRSRMQRIGIIVTLLRRYEYMYLPRILLIKRRLDQGLCLSDYNLVFLQTIISDDLKNSTLVKDCTQPEYKTLFIKIAGLYKEVVEGALRNEYLAMTASNDTVAELKYAA